MVIQIITHKITQMSIILLVRLFPFDSFFFFSRPGDTNSDFTIHSWSIFVEWKKLYKFFWWRRMDTSIRKKKKNEIWSIPVTAIMIRWLYIFCSFCSLLTTNNDRSKLNLNWNVFARLYQMWIKSLSNKQEWGRVYKFLTD